MPAFIQSEARQPRAWLQADGPNIPCLRASVSKTSKRASDTFHATIALDASSQIGLDASWWAAQDALDVSLVFAVYAGDAGQTLITGSVDEISIDWVARTVEVSGRDKSAKLAETRRSKKYNNQTVADIVSGIAEANGLNPVISGATGLAGKSYDQDQSFLVLSGTDFETLSALAEREGYRWYVDGDDLHFEPVEENGGVYTLLYRPPTPDQYGSANFVRLTTRRNLRAAKTAKVTVKSWHPWSQQLNEYTAEAPGADGDPLAYEFIVPMMSPAQVESLAKARAATAIRHELALDIGMPGDLAIDVTQKLSLTGTGTAYDQQYDIDAIHFEMVYAQGFEMRIQTKAPKRGRKAS
jgi:phage protein D